jgi:hypothetical protein
MFYLRNKASLTALFVIFSFGLISAAPFISAGRGHFGQEPGSRKKEKLETKASPEDELTYFVTITGGGYVAVADDLGHTNTPLVSSARGNEIGFIAPRVPDVSVDVLGKKTVQLVMPFGRNYTLSFRSSGDPMTITLIEGESDVIPHRALRYLDLVLPKDAQAMFRFTSKGVEPLRYDRDGDGTYESIVSATVVATGAEARDVTPPVVKFSERLAGAKRQVTIKATDRGSGVKIIYYSLDSERYQPYVKALLLDSGSSAMVYAFADDRVGNRSSVFSLAK